MDSHAADGPLVGRDPELQRLEQTLDALDRGEAGCLTVEGEPDSRSSVQITLYGVPGPLGGLEIRRRVAD